MIVIDLGQLIKYEWVEINYNLINSTTFGVGFSIFCLLMFILCAIMANAGQEDKPEEVAPPKSEPKNVVTLG